MVASWVTSGVVLETCSAAPFRHRPSGGANFWLCSSLPRAILEPSGDSFGASWGILRLFIFANVPGRYNFAFWEPLGSSWSPLEGFLGASWGLFVDLGSCLGAPVKALGHPSTPAHFGSFSFSPSRCWFSDFLPQPNLVPLLSTPAELGSITFYPCPFYPSRSRFLYFLPSRFRFPYFLPQPSLVPMLSTPAKQKRDREAERQNRVQIYKVQTNIMLLR